jgi:glycosyltransferase involved in cell wall biosynthesis
MHVALIGPYAGSGGVASSLTRLAHGLAAAGVRVTVLTPAGPGDEDATTGRRPDAPEVLRIRPRGSFGLPDERLLFPRAFRPWRRAVRERLAELRPDLVHGHGVLSHGLATTDWHRGPRVVTAHGNASRDLFNHHLGSRGSVTASMASAYAALTVKRADYVIGATADPRVNLPRRPRRFVHIPNIVPDVFFDTSPDPLPGRILYCGGTRLIKGGDVLARAWPAVQRAVPRAELVVVGASLPGATVLPALEPAGLAREMARSAALVVPSRFEVSPTVIAEAWAVGLPVVATAVGGVPAMASGAAVLVAPEDPDALARSLIRVLTDPDGDVRAEASRRVERYREPVVVEQHRRLYEDLVPGVSRASPARLARRAPVS